MSCRVKIFDSETRLRLYLREIGNFATLISTAKKSDNLCFALTMSREYEHIKLQVALILRTRLPFSERRIKKGMSPIRWLKEEF